MSSYSIILINKPFRAIERDVCAMLEAESSVPFSSAGKNDMFVCESSDGWTMLHDRESQLLASRPDIVERLLKCSAATSSQIRALTEQTNSGYVHLVIADSGQLVRQFEFCESISIDVGELPAWDDDLRRSPAFAAIRLVGVEASRPNVRTKSESLPPFNSELSQRHFRALEFGDAQWAIPLQHLISQYIEVTRAMVDDEALVLEAANSQPLRLRIKDVSEVFQNPFTGQPTISLEAGETYTIPFPIADDVWNLLQRWSGYGSTPLPPKPRFVFFDRKPQPPLKLQLIPLVTAGIGAAMGAASAWIAGTNNWAREGAISNAGIYGAIGFFVGSAILMAALKRIEPRATSSNKIAPGKSPGAK